MSYSLDDIRSSFALLDYRADRGESAPDLLAELGLDVDDVMHVAEQRGMRAAFLATGEMEKLQAAVATGVPTPVRMSAEQRKIMAIVAANAMETMAATLMLVRRSDGN